MNQPFNQGQEPLIIPMSVCGATFWNTNYITKSQISEGNFSY